MRLWMKPLDVNVFLQLTKIIKYGKFQMKSYFSYLQIFSSIVIIDDSTLCKDIATIIIIWGNNLSSNRNSAKYQCTFFEYCFAIKQYYVLMNITKFPKFSPFLKKYCCLLRIIAMMMKSMRDLSRIATVSQTSNAPNSQCENA